VTRTTNSLCGSVIPYRRQEYRGCGNADNFPGKEVQARDEEMSEMVHALVNIDGLWICMQCNAGKIGATQEVSSDWGLPQHHSSSF